MARVTRPGGHLVIGALNPSSPWGLAHRRRLRSGPWRGARFLDRASLRALGEPYGRVTLTGALYTPGALPALSMLRRVFERLGRLVPTWGAFQILVVELASPAMDRAPGLCHHGWTSFGGQRAPS